MALLQTEMNYSYILFSRQSSSFIQEAHLIVAVCSRTIAKQERSGDHRQNFWHTDQLYTFMTGNEVEKIIIKALNYLYMRHVSSQVPVI